MSLLSRLLGRKDAPASEPVCETYGDFRIYPEPMAEGNVYRIAARVETEVNGETKTHMLVRADTLNDHDSAVTASIGKAKQVIDEQGLRIFR
ncbi:HlyU family transcriptional regulator [uncultured Tateyamaria sp.]|uniref:HlyU family transcriptional regulator n=1 Tax=Tateyamaria sp. 1078 TaxID=3417464 RepID=UPI002637C899|nr:HlyU family transcriptional regulator [uncultured Tateyamaria sp.]